METKLTVKFNWNLRKRQTASSSESPVEQTQPCTCSKATAYRKRVKETNPEKYNELKKKERDRWHQRQLLAGELSEKDQEARRKLWKQQKAAQRAKRRGKPNTSLEQEVRKKFAEMTPDEKRQYWREKKRLKRNTETSQKKVSEKKKDRERKQRQRSKIPMDIAPSSISRASVYRTATQLKSQIPESPKSYVKVVEKLITTATPRKEAEFQSRQLSVKKKLPVSSDSDMESPVESSLRASIAETKASTSGTNKSSYMCKIHTK